ncbi:MAG: MEKHLA domain-containing protein [Gammaproteobacteria bacterium]|nr:MEKHLA domain-containing protein [Gammaproteobacteria bacterium]
MASAPTANEFLRPHVELLLDSHFRLTGRRLWPSAAVGATLAREVFEAPFVLLSHGVETDPVFNYANRAALTLFQYTWDEIIAIPSRESAEPANQAARAALMQRVTTQGFVDDYSGIRIAKSGARFRIERATVWNVTDAAGVYRGQAATFTEWTPV